MVSLTGEARIPELENSLQDAALPGAEQSGAEHADLPSTTEERARERGSEGDNQREREGGRQPEREREGGRETTRESEGGRETTRESEGGREGGREGCVGGREVWGGEKENNGLPVLSDTWHWRGGSPQHTLLSNCCEVSC